MLHVFALIVVLSNNTREGANPTPTTYYFETAGQCEAAKKAFGKTFMDSTSVADDDSDNKSSTVTVDMPDCFDTVIPADKSGVIKW
jgi:hypothetical protein